MSSQGDKSTFRLSVLDVKRKRVYQDGIKGVLNDNNSENKILSVVPNDLIVQLRVPYQVEERGWS